MAAISTFVSIGISIAISVALTVAKMLLFPPQRPQQEAPTAADGKFNYKENVPSLTAIRDGGVMGTPLR